MPTDFETAVSTAVSLSANVLSVYRDVEVPRQTIDLARALRVLATEAHAKVDELEDESAGLRKSVERLNACGLAVGMCPGDEASTVPERVKARVAALEAEVIAAKGAARIAEKRTDEVGKRLVEMKADQSGDVKSDG